MDKTFFGEAFFNKLFFLLTAGFSAKLFLSAGFVGEAFLNKLYDYGAVLMKLFFASLVAMDWLWWEIIFGMKVFFGSLFSDTFSRPFQGLFWPPFLNKFAAFVSKIT